MEVQKLGQHSRVAHIVYIVQPGSLGGIGRGAVPEDLARLDVGDPEGEAVVGDFVGDCAVGEVDAGEVVEAKGVREVRWEGERRTICAA